VGFAAIRLWQATPRSGSDPPKVSRLGSARRGPRIVIGIEDGHAVDEDRFAHMIAKIEAIQAWLESVTYQMCNMVSLLPFSTLALFPVARRASPHHPGSSVIRARK
jgi:hypothetical protein